MPVRCGSALLTIGHGGKVVKDLAHLSATGLVQHATCNVVSAPDQRLGRIVQHSPFGKAPLCDRFGHVKRYLKVSVIPLDARNGGLNSNRRAFKQLQVQILPADQRAGDAVAIIVPPGVHQNTVERRLIVTEGARRIDDLRQVRNGDAPRTGQIGSNAVRVFASCRCLILRDRAREVSLENETLVGDQASPVNWIRSQRFPNGS